MKRALVGISAAAGAFAQQTAFSPAGPYSSKIKGLGDIFVGLLGLIFLIVIAVAIGGIMRRPRDTDVETIDQLHRSTPSRERKLGMVVGWATGISILILLGLV